jgi:hypothetical protein
MHLLVVGLIVILFLFSFSFYMLPGIQNKEVNVSNVVRMDEGKVEALDTMGRNPAARTYMQLNANDIRNNADSVVLSAGVCLMYPRCLLYACCTPELFSASASVPEKLYEDINIPLNERMTNHPLANIIITREVLEQGLASLKPTPQNAYESLRQRQDFRVLYLSQGDGDRSNLPLWYLKNMKDLLYLSFRDVEADLYYPRSNLCEGRMALYLAARMLESNQGWLYDYYIFLDDDAIPNAVSSSTYTSFFFEMDLLQWEPAIAAPTFPVLTPNNAIAASTLHVDFLIIAYHREAVETLHPWVFDFDLGCTWASQLYQMYEMSLIYRNHILYTRDFHVTNTKHREYPRNCFASGGGDTGLGFPAVYEDIKRKLSPHRAHCLPLSPRISDSFPQYVSAGSVRPRISDYFLRNTSFDDGCTDVNFQSDSCCTVDVFNPPQTVGMHHGRVIKDISESRDIFSFVWGSSRWEFEGVETLTALGFNTTNILFVDSSILQSLPLTDTRSIHSKISSLPAGTRVRVKGYYSLVISNSGRAHLPYEKEVLQFRQSQFEDFFEIPLWRVRYLSLSTRAQGMFDALSRPFPWPSSPWFKIDFVYVPCGCSSCCRPFPEWGGRGPALALGDVNDPYYAGVVKSFAFKSLKIEDFISYLNLPPSQAFIVNIGAASAFSGYADPTQRLFAGLSSADLPVPFGGLLIDAQPPTSNFFGGYPVRSNVSIISSFNIEPGNVASVLQNATFLPPSFALLKVDIDSTDLGIISGILSGGFTPSVIYMEVNTAFPPPFRFSIPKDMSNAEQDDFQMRIWMQKSLFGGVSLSAAADFLVPKGYRLVEVDGWDAIWAHTDALTQKSLNLPSSLLDEFYRGLQSRVEDMQHCFCRSDLVRVVNDELWSLALEARSPDANIDHILASVREVIDKYTPRHPTSGVKMRFDFSISGPADDIYRS